MTAKQIHIVERPIVPKVANQWKTKMSGTFQMKIGKTLYNPLFLTNQHPITIQEYPTDNTLNIHGHQL